MNWLYRLQRRMNRFSIENLMLYITVTMLAVLLADMFFGINFSEWLYFDRDKIFGGQIWRLITFIFIPPSSSPIFILFVLYFYYFIGSTLEREWGSAQFTFYYLCGVVGAIIAGLIAGQARNYYLNMSLFLAFAMLYPNQQVLLFFIIPVKIKYLAYLDAAMIGFSFFFALFRFDWATCLSIIASLLNFLLFFGPDLWNGLRNRMRYGKQRRNFRKQTRNDENNFWRSSAFQ